MNPKDFASQIEKLGALDEPVRRRLYLVVVAEQDSGMSRDAAAKAAGVTRALAAFHLDKLVEAGLLDASFRRLSGRTGPGAGRPAKLYRRSGAPLDVPPPRGPPRPRGGASREALPTFGRATRRDAPRATLRVGGEDPGASARRGRVGGDARGTPKRGACARRGAGTRPGLERPPHRTAPRGRARARDMRVRAEARAGGPARAPQLPVRFVARRLSRGDLRHEPGAHPRAPQRARAVRGQGHAGTAARHVLCRAPVATSAGGRGVAAVAPGGAGSPGRPAINRPRAPARDRPAAVPGRRRRS